MLKPGIWLAYSTTTSHTSVNPPPLPPLKKQQQKNAEKTQKKTQKHWLFHKRPKLEVCEQDEEIHHLLQNTRN